LQKIFLMKSNFSYRPDIDGMRAIAVLLVVLYHADFPFITGGYIGVDVFFVLSGFLITLGIDKEMNHNSFSFKQFYLRRIRRIIPVLVFIMLVVTIPAYFILFSDDLESYARTLMHTILSTNNIHLWINNGDYFAGNSDLKPFLHTWSLSVEEQFYFLWPLVLLFMHRKLSLEKRLVFISLFLILGIILSVYLTNTNPNFAYFLLPARIFELTIGACLAMFWRKLPVFTKKTNSFLSIIGIVIILVPAVLLNKSSSFPGLNALLPCIGTALLIFTGKEDKNKGIVNKLLLNKGLVIIGLISYSMYLWHWPIFVFIKYLGFNLDGLVRIFSLVLIFMLSYFSWRFVEQPFRIRYKYNFKKTLLFIFLPSLAAITLIYAVLDSKDGFPERFPELSEFTPKTNYPNKVRKQCFDKFKIGNCEDCFLGIKKDTLDGMLIGDSFANHTAAFLDVLAKDAELYIHDSAAGGYPLMNGLNDDGSAHFPEQYAVDRLNYAKKFKNIFIAANWESLSDPKNKATYLSTIKTLGELVKTGKKIIVFEALRTTTEMNIQRAKLIKAKIPVYFSERNFSFPEYKRPNNYIINEIKRKFPSIIIINLNELMCENGNCKIELDNTIVYRNPDHLNTSGAILLGESYLKKYDNPLKKLNSK
jgi:peptidoglycan/LPS O-acetylase OafA/YrhL